MGNHENYGSRCTYCSKAIDRAHMNKVWQYPHVKGYFCSPGCLDNYMHGVEYDGPDWIGIEEAAELGMTYEDYVAEYYEFEDEEEEDDEEYEDDEEEEEEEDV